MQPLRYGIVGGGFIAGFQLQALRQVQGIEVAGFVSKDPLDKVVAYTREHNLGEGRDFGTISEMVPNVDVVALFMPNFARLQVVEEIVDAVKAGAKLKAIICEKPLARNMKEARRVLELLKEVNLPTVYFENQVHMKALQATRRQLTRVMDSMGSPLLLRSNEEHAGPHNGWFWDPTRQGGGVMSDMGCHCLAVGWYMLTPPGKPVDFLRPQSVQADLSLLKWGQPRWRKELLDKYGVDYLKTPAEDFATGTVTYKNPETGQLVKAQFTVSWMYDKQGLRLLCDGLGAGYAFEFNTLRSPLELFIGDVAAEAVADAEAALEKSQSSRGLLAVQPNEADLYGYTDENVDLVAAIAEGRPALLNCDYGLEIVQLTMAAYLSAERGAVVDLTDPATLEELETYVPLIQQGRGTELLSI
ncbi:MAG: Gfo/Idh/MocA family oxidoreductase [Thermoguttaceae bacterium]|jgi:predicted dehydrogenase|nr:Gfo/Idh/MocA family oxidoreductase [Thermoguttaceae bacterium]